MSGDTEPDDIPSFDDVFPDLDVAGQLLTALANDDDEAINALRESTDTEWWNVAWTLALLVRGLHASEPASVCLATSLMASEPDGI